MSAISTIRIRDFIETARYFHPRQTVLMRGRHGIGKSELAYQLAKVWGLTTIVERRIAQLSEGDMIGLPDRDATRIIEVDGQKLERRVTSFLPTDWFTVAETQPTLVFLDEINRGTPEVQQAAFQFVEKGELNGRKIHPLSRIVAAVNFSREYNVTPMGFAFLDRFAIFDIDPDKQDWINWAKAERIYSPDDSYQAALYKICPTNVHPIITDFIRQCNKQHFEVMPEDQAKMDPHEITPSRRSWARLSNHLVLPPGGSSPLISLPNHNAFYHLSRSLVGPDAARALQTFVQQQGSQVTPDSVLNDFDKVKPRVKLLTPEELVSLIDKIDDTIRQMGPKLKTEHCKNLSKFMEEIPEEIGISLWTKLSKGNLETAAMLHKAIGKQFLRLVAASKIGDQIPDLRDRVGK